MTRDFGSGLLGRHHVTEVDRPLSTGLDFIILNPEVSVGVED